MDIRILTIEDIDQYKDMIYDCYEDNGLIFDDQNPLLLMTASGVAEFIKSFVYGEDSLVFGIMDDDLLQGLIILDHIRYGLKSAKTKEQTSCAEVHICMSRAIWGKPVLGICHEFQKISPVDILYCNIPENAVGALTLCKRVGFKKTGYIPYNLPYENINGDTILRDSFIMTWIRKRQNICLGINVKKLL